jgi:phosphomannomutase
MDQVFKAYDVRGTVPDQLDADMCRAIGRAMARFADAPQILVARDMRETGVALSAAFSDGVRAEGVDIVDLGMASTDFMYFASGHLDSPVHGVAQPGPVQRPQVVPVRGAPHRARHRPGRH